MVEGAVQPPGNGFEATRRKIRKLNLDAYLLLLPALALAVGIYLYPIIQLLQFSLYRVVNIDNMRYVGLTNFARLLRNDEFPIALTNNLKLLLAVPVLLIGAAFLAIMLTEQMPGWRIYRALLFLPYVLPVPVVGIAFSQMLKLHGVINTVLQVAGLGVLAKDWLGDSRLALPVVAAVIIWKEMGFAMILFLARLLGVPRELYEAAEIDGAGWWHKVRFISLPQIRGVAAILAILESFALLSWVFGYVYTMTVGGPGYSTSVMEFFIYKAAFNWSGELGLASAVCVLLFVVALGSIPLRAQLEAATYD